MSPYLRFFILQVQFHDGRDGTGKRILGLVLTRDPTSEQRDGTCPRLRVGSVGFGFVGESEEVVRV